MGYTNTTAHYNLPQYVSTDVPSILGDVNGAYSVIDAAIYAAAEDATDAKTDAASAVSAVSAAQADATQALSVASAAQTDATTALTNAATAQTTANSAVSAAGTAQTTADGAVIAAGAAQADATSALTLLGNTTLPTTAQTVTGAIAEINTKITPTSVSHTAASGETMTQALDALYALIDSSKITINTKLTSTKSGVTTHIYALTEIHPNNTRYDFSEAHAYETTACYVAELVVKASSSNYYEWTLNTDGNSVNNLSSGDASGITFTIYY